MTTERDNRTRIVLSWLREEAHENAERVLLRALGEVDTTPQRRAWWPAWRTDRMKAFANLVAAAAAVLVVAIVGFQFLPGGSGPGGPTAAPSPSASLIARGSFVEHDRGLVEFEAIREGSSVTGRMTAAWDDGFGPFTVDLRCMRATDNGLVMIGGYVTIGNQPHEPGTPAWIALQRGSPDRASVLFGSLIGVPGTRTTDCLAYLDASLQEYRRQGWTIPLGVLDGGVEFGP